jgi:hypothetical protein
MPLIATRGAASAQGFGEFAQSGPVNYIEDVFSTYLYTGNGSTQTITNGIDLSSKGGLVWLKGRSLGYNHGLFDTVRGADYWLCSNNTDPSTSISGIPANAWITGFNSNGFGLGSNGSANASSQTYASWTFREQPKFFDIVTYTGNGSTQTINHNLGSTPGFIVTKRLDSTSNWRCYHQSLGTSKAIDLNLTNAALTGLSNYYTAVSSTSYSIGDGSEINTNGATYVAYLFAHNAGGFGASGSDNVISCGSFTTDGSGAATVTLGYEPQWLLVKVSSTSDDWNIGDNMRGMPNGGTAQTALKWLKANSSSAESTASTNYWYPTATGFTVPDAGYNNATFIYIAIRRGPMKTPTSGTSVFAPYVTNTVAASSSGSTSGSALYRSDFVTDFVIQTRKASATDRYVVSRLLGNQYLVTNTTAAEATSTAPWDSNIGALNFATDYGQWMFRRAPGFFDVVCGTGTGANVSVNHNLTVLPELIIVKRRSSSQNWQVAYWGGGGTNAAISLALNLTDGTIQNSTWSGTATSTTFETRGTAWYSIFDQSGSTYVAYLFASVSGVSKVGSYTGTGALQTVNCGFTGGARFVLIKRTDSTGDWWVYDSARGISSSDDPYLFLNSTASEVTNTNYVDTTSVGFQVTAAAPAGLNANGGSYIFLAIA